MSTEPADTAAIRAEATHANHGCGLSAKDDRIVALCAEVDRLTATLDRVRAQAVDWRDDGYKARIYVTAAGLQMLDVLDAE